MPYLCLWRRNFCAAGGVLFSYSGAIFERLKVSFHRLWWRKICLPCTIDHAEVITSISVQNGHKAPPKSLGHLRLRELRRQPLQKFAQKAPQPTALKPPSTARTAGRSDWAERRFRRQPFILLSFSPSKKARKAQETQSYQRIQHIVHTDFNTSGTNGPRGETGVSPPSVTAQSCATSEITLYVVFVTPDSAALLYTYISRFSVNPHHQQQLYLRPSFIPIFNFSHKRPTFAFTGESGYTLAFANRIAHNGTHAETGAFRTGPLSLPSERSARSPTSPGRVSERQTLPLLGLGRECSQRTQRAYGTAMRLCVSLFRGVAAPLGCVIFFTSIEIAVSTPCAQDLSAYTR